MKINNAVYGKKRISIMKKAIAFLLLTTMILSVALCACSSENDHDQSGEEIPSGSSKEPGKDVSAGEETSESSSEESQSSEISGTSESSEVSESSETSEPSEISDTPAEPKPYPVVSGTFMQPGTFANYSVAQMKQHLSYMKEVGIDTLILQWSFATANGKVTQAYYNSSFPADAKAGSFNGNGAKFLEVLLSAAEEVGFKVWIGLNDSDEWWNVGVNDRSWIEKQASLGLMGAEQIYKGYKEKYPNAFAGWYFVFEFYNMKANAAQVENAAYILNLYRDGLYQLSPELPMLLSPFITAAGASPVETQTLWSNVFAKTHFRKGDIFTCQDSVGAGHITIDKLDAFFKAIKAAVDTKPEISFWANNEDFTSADWSTAPLDRFVRQLEITDPYVDGHITFAYSHYQNPDVGKTGYHAAYKTYFETGKIPESVLPAPEATYENNGDGSQITISGTIKNADKTLMGIKIVKNGSLLKLIDFTAQYGKEQYSFTYNDTNYQGSGSADYKVFGIDYYGNEGPAYTFSVKFESRSGVNVAAGKTYTLPIPPQSSYPDEDGKALTDGKTGQTSYSDPAWIGFLGKPEIVIDLGKTFNSIYGFEVDTMGGGAAAIYTPTEFIFSISDDGKTFQQIEKFRYPSDTDTSTLYRAEIKKMLQSDVSARYVKITVGTNQSWIFIDEVKVFAD